MCDMVFNSTSMAKLDDDKKSVIVTNFDNKELSGHLSDMNEQDDEQLCKTLLCLFIEVLTTLFTLLIPKNPKYLNLLKFRSLNCLRLSFNINYTPMITFSIEKPGFDRNE